MREQLLKSITSVSELMDSGDANTVLDLALTLIDPDPNQPRQTFGQEALRELMDSITQQGILQPIVVRPEDKAGRYRLIFGERRLRACKALGHATIPALVKD